MDARLIFGLGVSVIGLAIRWRFPAVHRFVATFLAGVGIGLIAWAAFPSVTLPYGAAGIVGFGIVAVAIDWLMTPKPKAAPPILQEYRRPSTTIKVGRGGTLNLEDINSEADTLLDVEEIEKLSLKRGRHKPPGD